MSQQRKKLFIDASFLEDPAVDDWPLVYQMGYLRLWVESDNVGVWKPHFRKLEFNLKTEVAPDNFLECLNSGTQRVKVLPNDNWWLIDYLPLQVNTLTPTNRPHVSYIEDLLFHGLLTEYAKQNPNYVKFNVIFDLKNYDEIEDIQERKKARRAFQYLDSKDLVRPLQEACESLARPTQGSKDKEQEQEQKKEADKEEDRDNDQDQEQIRNVLDGTNFYKKLKSEVGGLALINSGDLKFDKDVDQILEELNNSNIKDSKKYLWNDILKTDWTITQWPQYRDKFLESEEIPF